MQRNGFTFYRSMFETVSDFVDESEPDEEKRKAEADMMELEWYRAIFNFIFLGETPKFQNRELKIAWRNVLPVLQKSNNLASSRAVVDKKSIQNNSNQSETIKNNSNQSGTNENRRASMITNLETSYKLVNNIFNNYELAEHCEHIQEKTFEEREPFKKLFKEILEKIPSSWENDANEIIDTMIEASNQANSEEGLKFYKKHYNGKEFATLLSTLNCNNFEKVLTSVRHRDGIKNKPVYILACLIQQAEQNIRKK